jgi:hypothetical protein
MENNGKSNAKNNGNNEKRRRDATIGRYGSPGPGSLARQQKARRRAPAATTHKSETRISAVADLALERKHEKPSKIVEAKAAEAIHGRHAARSAVPTR